MRKLFILLLVIFCAFTHIHAAVNITQGDLEQVLKHLDQELDQRQKYLDIKQLTIDSLRQVVTLQRGDIRAARDMMRLGDLYSAVNNDSALYFFSRGSHLAKELGNDTLSLKMHLRELSYLPLAGFNRRAVEGFEAIDTAGMSATMLPLYYEAGRRLFNYVAAFYPNSPETVKYAREHELAAQEQLLRLLPEGSTEHSIILAENHFRTHRYAEAEEILTALIGNMSEDDPQYPRVANFLAETLQARGNNDAYVYYLAKSAAADTRNATLEVASLQSLGRILFEHDETDRAYRYLSIATENAVQCHAILRIVQSTEALPIIEKAHNIHLEASRRRINLTAWILALLSVSLVGLLIYLYKEMQKMNRLQARLRQANHTKDVYLSQFLTMCSIYMDKLNQFCKVAYRKLSTGNADDLLQLTKSGKFVEEQSREFYEVFDDAFLHIYPTFVEDVNKLLQPDGQEVLKEGERLNTDLRILAFMRLGIEESTRIAQMLNYSVYTIYTYRNKIKNRAINRETFEADLMKIGSV